MELDRLIGEVARVTGVRLERSDPILAASVINEVMLDQALARLSRQMKAETDRATAAGEQSIERAKRLAEVLLAKAAEWSEERLKVASQQAAQRVLEVLEQETERARRASRIAVRAAWIGGSLGVLSCCFAAGMAVAAFVHS